MREDFNKISGENVLQALNEIDEKGVPEEREATDYWLKYENKTYPPKYVISIAYKFAMGEQLPASEFSGGNESNQFLKSKGFEIIQIEGNSLDSEEQTIGHEFASQIRKYLENNNIGKVRKNRGRLTSDSGTIIHVRGSKILSGGRRFYHLIEKDYKELVNVPNSYFAIVYGSINKTFVIPGKQLVPIFSEQAPTRTEGK